MKPVLQQIEIAQEQSILAFRYQKPTFEAPWHFHPEHELIYIKKSTGTKFIGDYVGPFEPGELVLMNSNLPHCWKKFTNESEESHSVVVHWKKETFNEVSELDIVFDMLKMASKGIIFDQKSIEPLLPKLEKLPDYAEHHLYVNLLSLLIELSKCPYETLSENLFTAHLSSVHTHRMAKIHDFVEANFDSKVYLADVAEKLNMTELSFSRFFKKMMGRPFFVFLNEYRINRAARMLIETDIPVVEISFLCGYESPPFFHKQFQKFIKLTPMKYRKKFLG